jgi:hypothetical protein
MDAGMALGAERDQIPLLNHRPIGSGILGDGLLGSTSCRTIDTAIHHDGGSATAKFRRTQDRPASVGGFGQSDS